MHAQMSHINCTPIFFSIHMCIIILAKMVRYSRWLSKRLVLWAGFILTYMPICKLQIQVKVLALWELQNVIRWIWINYGFDEFWIINAPYSKFTRSLFSNAGNFNANKHASCTKICTSKNVIWTWKSLMFLERADFSTFISSDRWNKHRVEINDQKHNCFFVRDGMEIVCF